MLCRKEKDGFTGKVYGFTSLGAGKKFLGSVTIMVSGWDQQLQSSPRGNNSGLGTLVSGASLISLSGKVYDNMLPWDSHQSWF